MIPTPQEVAASANRFALAITAVCRNDGISVSKDGVASVNLKPDATAQERSDAQAVIASFDWSIEAQAAWELARVPEKKALLDTKDADLVRNGAYLAITKPTADDNTAQLQALTQEVMRMRGFVGKVAEDSIAVAVGAVSVDSLPLQK